MKVVFMGTTQFSLVILKALLESGYDVVAVVTQPDRPYGRKKKLKASVIKQFAIQEGIDVLQPEKIKDAYDKLKEIDMDLIITCAYGQFVPDNILNLARHSALNVHASLLPKYRGGAPIHWSIINGEKETGVTLMEMIKRMDAGDMISKRKVKIELHETMGDVEKKLMRVSVDLIKEDLPLYLEGKIVKEKQDECEASFAYAIRKEDEEVSFDRPVMDVYNHIRGLIPWPVSFAYLNHDRVKFHQASFKEYKHSYKPGTIIDITPKGMEIACHDGHVRIEKIQPSGKKVMDALSFYNGYKDLKGQVFEGE